MSDSTYDAMKGKFRNLPIKDVENANAKSIGELTNASHAVFIKKIDLPPKR